MVIFKEMEHIVCLQVNFVFSDAYCVIIYQVIVSQGVVVEVVHHHVALGHVLALVLQVVLAQKCPLTLMTVAGHP